MHHVPWISWTSAAQTNVLDDWPAVAPSWTSLASRPSRAHWEDLIVYAQLNLIHGGTVTQEQQRILDAEFPVATVDAQARRRADIMTFRSKNPQPPRYRGAQHPGAAFLGSGTT